MVLETPELLLSILAESDIKTCAIAARVNKKWNKYALHELWKILPSPIPLFEQLAELGPDGESESNGERDNDGGGYHLETHVRFRLASTFPESS